MPIIEADKPKELHVAVGVIEGADGRILIAHRNGSQHQGNKWEFPGGKVEAGETVTTALARELDEELGIEVLTAESLISIHYNYPDRAVWLDVWKVTEFVGEPQGREGQPVLWVEPALLGDYTFPAANAPIVLAAQLPRTLQGTEAELMPVADCLNAHNHVFADVYGVCCRSIDDVTKAQRLSGCFLFLECDANAPVVAEWIEHAQQPVYLPASSWSLEQAVNMGAQGILLEQAGA